jgi:DNA-binding transcriptional ArsR family regulator
MLNVSGSVSEPGQDRLSLVLFALAHPVRRDLIDMVRRAPARVTELAAGFDMSLPAVSRHIRVLDKARIVQRRVVGRDHFILPAEDGLADVADWVTRRSGEWRERLEALKSLMEAEDG